MTDPFTRKLDQLRADIRYQPTHRYSGLDGCTMSRPVPVRVTLKNGRRLIKLQCPECHRVGGAIPYTLIHPDEVPNDLRSHLTDIACEHCGARDGVEEHHWAPRAIFGFDEADRWPTSHLCPDCHRRWHSLMAQQLGGRP